MKKEIHPEYFDTTVKCGCGNTFTTRSTRQELTLDICNACHPFYTGKLKFVDTAGRIEKFKSKFAEGKLRQSREGEKESRQKASLLAASLHRAACTSAAAPLYVEWRLR